MHFSYRLTRMYIEFNKVGRIFIGIGWILYKNVYSNLLLIKYVNSNKRNVLVHNYAKLRVKCNIREKNKKQVFSPI